MEKFGILQIKFQKNKLKVYLLLIYLMQMKIVLNIGKIIQKIEFIKILSIILTEYIYGLLIGLCLIIIIILLLYHDHIQDN